MELDDELHNITIGDSTIMEYCTKIKSISNLLTNNGALVPECNLVIYTINGLSSKYAHVIPTIGHQKPLPTFLELKSILTLEERSMAKDHSRQIQASHQDHASSATILATEHQNRSSNSRFHNSGNWGGGRNQRGGSRGGRNSGRGGGRQGRSDGGSFGRFQHNTTERVLPLVDVVARSTATAWVDVLSTAPTGPMAQQHNFKFLSAVAQFASSPSACIFFLAITPKPFKILTG